MWVSPGSWDGGEETGEVVVRLDERGRASVAIRGADEDVYAVGRPETLRRLESLATASPEE